MIALYSILIVIVCVLLVLVILVQNPKGGGLGQAFGDTGANMLGGVKKTADFLDRATWTLVIVLFALVMVVNMTTGEEEVEQDVIVAPQVEDAEMPLNNLPLGGDLPGGTPEEEAPAE